MSGAGLGADHGEMRTDRVVVEAPARLHFGMLDLGGSLGRRYGGIGAAIEPPSVLLSAAPTATGSAGRLLVIPDPATHEGLSDPHALEAAACAASAVLGHYGISEGVAITVHRTLPAHRGLGSGTQVALAAARAVAEIFELATNSVQLAEIVGRGRRSAIGTHVFQHGGLVVEGGRREGYDHPAPLLARVAMPELWRCVLVVPPAQAGVSGAAEAAAFAGLRAPPVAEAERVAHLVLMALLPAAIEGDFATFGEALSEIQQVNGRWFAPAQGGPFAQGPSAAIISRLASWGATGVGQSSWGPAVYAVMPDPDATAALAGRIRAAFPEATVLEARFANVGATVRSGL